MTNEKSQVGAMVEQALNSRGFFGQRNENSNWRQKLLLGESDQWSSTRVSGALIMFMIYINDML